MGLRGRPFGPNGVTNGTTPVTMVLAPAEENRRIIEEVNLYNSDAGSVVAVIKVLDSASGGVDTVIDRQSIATLTSYQWQGQVNLDSTTKTLSIELESNPTGETDWTVAFFEILR